MTSPEDIVKRTRTIAVVGFSGTPGKDAHEVPRELLDDFTVYPVNPSTPEILGRRTYARLADVPTPVDLVNVFRPSAEAADIARQAAEVGAKALWLQSAIRSDEARRIAEDAGMDYVEDTCIRVVRNRMNRT